MWPVIRDELHKITMLPMIWGFLVICAVMNIALASLHAASIRGDVDFVGRVVSTAGRRIDGGFDQRLRRLPESPRRKSLLQALQGNVDVPTGREVIGIGTRYADLLHDEGYATLSHIMLGKYRTLADRAGGARLPAGSADLYLGVGSERIHNALFGVILGGVTWEAISFAVLAMLYALGYERLMRTEATVMTARFGRRIVPAKTLAAAMIGVCGFLLFVLSAIAPYAVMFAGSPIWGMDVSGPFNRMTTELGEQPFLTWTRFTLAGYLAASTALSFMLTLVSMLAAALAGTLCRSMASAFSVTGLAMFATGALPAICSQNGWWGVYHLISAGPMHALLNRSMWFTDMGLKAVIPYQECIETLVSAVVLTIAVKAAWRGFRRRDL
ncbi:hypothetical protein Uis1B_1806 [Bifidobacterium margollesii]|uniref:ABC transporter permease n=1 Tax=Bifidobacterium margollesii TaxID=2020964 RepID=A0A2N5J7X7_9BIFI|nr:hypothetical protein [Bifidobacterium margollesii]PLS30319.1 hypothetical protein Uis1B_1806 [Bifidobacterium margollesii]